MDNDINEIKALVNKKSSIIEKIKSIIIKVFNFKKDKKKFSTEVINPKIFALNFPQYANISNDQMNKLIKARQEEIKARKQLEEKYGMEYQEIVKKLEHNTVKGLSNIEEDFGNDFNPDLEEYATNKEELEPMIYNKESYDKVIAKLDSGEITEDELSISDLLKINAMLKAEFDIKLKKLEEI